MLRVFIFIKCTNLLLLLTYLILQIPSSLNYLCIIFYEMSYLNFTPDEFYFRVRYIPNVWYFFFITRTLIGALDS